MLRELRLSNLAVIEKAALEFGEGFTVLTGETGAGKSLLVGALNLILGARASSELIRTGAAEATVEAAFEGGDSPRLRALLEEAGLPVEDTLIVRRTISTSGKNKVYLNGALAPLNTLAEVGEELVGIMGQHEHHALLRPEVHRNLLDTYAGNEALLEKMQATYGALAEAREALESLSSDENERARRIDYLKFLTEELAGAGLRAGEEEELEEERARLANAEKITQAASSGYELLYEAEGAVADRLNTLLQSLQNLVSVEPGLAEAHRLLTEAEPLIQEAARTLQDVCGKFGEDADSIEARLNEVETRLDLLTRLKRKHAAGDVTALIALQEKLSAELEALQDYDSQLESRRKALAKAESEAQKAADALSRARTKAATSLGKDVARELADLNMKGASIEALVEPGEEVHAHGSDRVEFRFAPNPGERPQPLVKIASGGELSRVLLALRLVLTEPGQVRTLVLDEVDSGVGGVTAEVIGRKIRQLAGNFQVVCITHLPQIACQAHNHLRVEKKVTGGRTGTVVETLSSEDRVEEISRMLGGASVTNQVRAAAKELLAQAGG